MKLKQLIKYGNAPALEATWVEEVQLPDVSIPAVVDDAGNEIEPARTEPGGVQEVVVKCQAYSNAQMDMLAADLGTDAAKHQALLDEVAATYVEPPPEPPYVPQSISRAQGEYILIEMTDAEGVSYMDKLRAAIAAIPSKKRREQAEVAVFATQEWRFDSPTLNAMMVELGITEQQKIEMFVAAKQVTF